MYPHTIFIEDLLMNWDMCHRGEIQRWENAYKHQAAIQIKIMLG